MARPCRARMLLGPTRASSVAVQRPGDSTGASHLHHCSRAEAAGTAALSLLQRFPPLIHFPTSLAGRDSWALREPGAGSGEQALERGEDTKKRRKLEQGREARRLQWQTESVKDSG